MLLYIKLSTISNNFLEFENNFFKTILKTFKELFWISKISRDFKRFQVISSKVFQETFQKNSQNFQGIFWDFKDFKYWMRFKKLNELSIDLNESKKISGDYKCFRNNNLKDFKWHQRLFWDFKIFLNIWSDFQWWQGI